MKGMSAFSAIQTILLGGKKSFLSEQSVPDTLRANTRKIVLNVYKCTRKKRFKHLPGDKSLGPDETTKLYFQHKKRRNWWIFFSL